MSFDLAVWDGDRPANDIEAAQVFDQLYAELMESGEFYAVALAAGRRLVCYDPQYSTLR